ncbi:MAG TPA: 50S ribosomal protein L25/general stress protein Ctc [Actinomycetota bacterium]|nr:50S ribosomal protein L25/general stress protein Ctc [Actinomycetota bacterium]
MAEQKLVANKREDAGKGVARKLRAAGRVPGVLYGKGVDPVALSVDGRDLIHVFHTGAGTNVLIDLDVDGQNHLAMPREVQRDHIKGRFLHVDFIAVSRDQRVTISVPIRLVGESPGVKLGGVLEHHLWEVEVECLPTNIPDAIDADVSTLEEIGQSLKVADLMVSDGATILTGPDESVVAVQQPQARIELEEEEAAAAEAEAAEGEAEEAEGAIAEEAEGAAESSEG